MYLSFIRDMKNVAIPRRVIRATFPELYIWRTDSVCGKHYATQMEILIYCFFDILVSIHFLGDSPQEYYNWE